MNTEFEKSYKNMWFNCAKQCIWFDLYDKYFKSLKEYLNIYFDQIKLPNDIKKYEILSYISFENPVTQPRTSCLKIFGILPNKLNFTETKKKRYDKLFNFFHTTNQHNSNNQRGGKQRSKKHKKEKEFKQKLKQFTKSKKQKTKKR